MNPKDLTIEEQRAIDKARTPGVWTLDSENASMVNDAGEWTIGTTWYDGPRLTILQHDIAFIEAASANYGVNLDIIVAQQEALDVLRPFANDLQVLLNSATEEVETLNRKIAELEHYIEGLEHPEHE